MMKDSEVKPVGDSETEWVKTNAYIRWVNAGRPDGRDFDFWLAAKNEYSLLFWGKPFPPQAVVPQE